MRSKHLILLLTALMATSLWGCGSNMDSDGFQAAAETPEEIARATSFVGADRCGGCHEKTHEGWAATAHTQKLRDGALEVNYSNDGNDSGRSDFFDATEVDIKGYDGSANKYDTFGDNAPVLGSDSGGAYVKIGAAKHYVVFTMGGSATHAIAVSNESDQNGDGLILNDEAQWKQRYVTKIGNSHYILPVQFNQQTGEYTTYDTDKWYDANNLPMAKPTNNNAYERRCAGCHLTGVELALQGAEWTMNFSDRSVACEACHGPGGQHAASPNKDNILNPATMTTDQDLNGDGAVDQLDNLTVRNYVCFHCHSRGAGKYTANGTTVSYSSKAGPNNEVQLYLPGLDWTEYYDITESGSNYWGGTPDSGDFITSKSHHQQQQDLMAGPHAPDKPYDHECFVCHDMHSTANEHMVASEVVEDGITIAVDTTQRDNGAKDNRNNLCLSCHAGHGDFEELSVVDISAGSDKVAEVSKAHMAKRTAKARSLDPGRSMFSCTSCHMPITARSAIWVEEGTGVFDENGDEIMEVVEGDISSHVLTIVWPSLSETNPGMPNACNGCHNGDSTDADPAVSQRTAGTAIIRDWAKSAHGDENGEGWKHYDWDGDANRQSCQRCHTATGALNYFTDPANYDAANNEFNLPEGKNQVLYCYGCHSGTPATDGFGTQPHDPGAITIDYTDAPFTYPDVRASNVCLNCHTGRESGDSIKASTDDFTDKRFVNSHYLAAGGIIFGATGYEFDIDGDAATDNYANVPFYAHDQIGLGEGENGPCVGCHMTSAQSHGFLPVKHDEETGAISAITSTACVECHDAFVAEGGDEAAVAAAAAFLTAEEEDFEAALEALAAQLAAAGHPFLGGYPYFDQGDWTNGGTLDGKDAMGAAFNYNLLAHDPGAWAHNRFYTKRLIYDAIDYLDDAAFNASVGAAIDALALDAAVAEAAKTYLDGDGTAAGVQRP